MLEEQLFAHALVDIRLQAYPIESHEKVEYHINTLIDDTLAELHLCLVQDNLVKGRYVISSEFLSDSPSVKMRLNRTKNNLRRYLTSIGLTVKL